MHGFLLVDHGSRRRESNKQLEDMAQRVQRLRPDAVVSFAHMEICDPSIADGFAALAAGGATTVTVLMYFLSNGRHVTTDVPELVTAAAADYPHITWSIGQALGPHDQLAQLMLDRAGA